MKMPKRHMAIITRNRRKEDIKYMFAELVLMIFMTAIVLMIL